MINYVLEWSRNPSFSKVAMLPTCFAACICLRAEPEWSWWIKTKKNRQGIDDIWYLCVSRRIRKTIYWVHDTRYSGVPKCVRFNYVYANKCEKLEKNPISRQYRKYWQRSAVAIEGICIGSTFVLDWLGNGLHQLNEEMIDPKGALSLSLTKTELRGEIPHPTRGDASDA